MSLSRNKVEKVDIKQLLTSFPNLKLLNLSQNYIKSICESKNFYENESLEKLILSRNHLKTTADFKYLRLTNLTLLTLFGNYIEFHEDSKVDSTEK